MLPYLPTSATSEAILEFYTQITNSSHSRWNLRERFLAVDLAYACETDCTEEQYKAKLANKRGDSTKFQNITMPVIMPQVENAVTYQQSVFLSGFPIFGSVAAPQFIDAATQMDTVIGEQQIKGNWVPQLLRALRNGFKYNLGPVEVAWETQVSYALEDAGAAGSAIDKQKEVAWSGTTITSLDPYNTFWDTRVAPSEVCKSGEFAGYTRLMSRIAFKQFLASLPTRINVKEALESPSNINTASIYSTTSTYYVPKINPNSMYTASPIGVGQDWFSWAGMEESGAARIKYQNMYEVAVVYGRILPSDFRMSNVPSKNTPQVWKFIVVNGQVVVYAERLTNAHTLIPILFAQPNDDGLSYQSKSLADSLDPFQAITTALSNSTIAARRRSISDRMLYDPSRVSKADIANDSPAARIPVRPSAFGSSLADAVHQIPYRDDQAAFTMPAMQSFLAIANQVSGFNPARQGQFVKGNKTRFEFQETMQYANGRDQSVALVLEGNFFAPMKEIIKTNILQYQGGVSLFNRDSQKLVVIDPVALRKASLDFRVADGLLPSDKLIDGESLALAFQTLAGNQQLAAGYNITPMFSYIMKARGAKISAFEKSHEQVAYEQAVGAWQQTVQGIIQQLLQAGQTLDPNTMQQMFPPQPTPDQFGYNPADVTKAMQMNQMSVMQLYAQAAAPAQTQTQAPTPGTPQ